MSGRSGVGGRGWGPGVQVGLVGPILGVAGTCETCSRPAGLPGSTGNKGWLTQLLPTVKQHAASEPPP